jgi:DNA (cytosine-5)-methyltransferase 1
MTDRPVLLDLGCGGGGASKGYHDAGFDVIGVDIERQPRYPFTFWQGDAMTVSLDGFDAYHVSMPCHDHTSLRSLAGLDGTGWLLAAVRDRVKATGEPYVIENVPGAPMRPDLRLCGCMFDPPLRTYRLRWFEFSDHLARMIFQLPHRDHGRKTATTRRRERWAEGWHVSVTGDIGTYCGPEAMGIDWMNGNELSQAVPPVYTKYIGDQLHSYLDNGHVLGAMP